LRWAWPWQDRNRRFSWLKAGAFAFVLLPAVRTAWLVGAGEYGTVAALVLNGLTFWSGVWATAVLLAALAVTPAAAIFRWPAFADVRRMTGVAALAYTIAHIVLYFAFRSFDFAFIAADWMRLTLVLATLSTLGLIVLGATSVDAVIRRMGARNWRRLHATTYAIGGLALLHVVLARGTYAEQYMLAGIFFWLMSWRLLARHGLGASGKALLMLAAASCLFTALLEAGFLWGRRGYDVFGTLGLNFNPAFLAALYPPAWRVLAFGLAVALAAAGRAALTAAHSGACRAAARCAPSAVAPVERGEIREIQRAAAQPELL
jgi:sulfoxide reductase heme-binding subunit YedZ